MAEPVNYWDAYPAYNPYGSGETTAQRLSRADQDNQLALMGYAPTGAAPGGFGQPLTEGQAQGVEELYFAPYDLTKDDQYSDITKKEAQEKVEPRKVVGSE